MREQKQRFVVLAMVMVILIGVISIISTWLFYYTSLTEQKHRMHELVQSQASLVVELERLALHLKFVGEADTTREVVLDHLVRAYRRFQIESKSGEFVVGMRSGSKIRFLIVNGEKVPSFSPLASIPLGGLFAAPMEEALAGETGTMIGLDYEGKEVLAAYTPLILRYDVLGIVAKIDVEEIKAPFYRASFIIFGVGVVLILIGLVSFFKLSEPILQDIKQSEKNYRDLVEGTNNLIIRIDRKGIITFANCFAKKFIAFPGDDLVGLSARKLLFDGGSQKEKADSVKNLLHFFGEGDGPYELPLPSDKGGTEWISWTVRELTDENDEVCGLLCIGNDITSKRAAREAQREIEERFRGITKASPVGIIITDMEGHLIYANERMHSIIQLDAVEMVGHGWLHKIFKNDRQILEERWFKTKSIIFDRMEFQIGNQDDYLWILGQIVDLKNSEGDVVGHVITLTDITQIKQAESEQKRLTAAIDQAAEAVIITDLDGNITYVNPAFEQNSGYSREEAIGQNTRILKSGEHNEEFYKELWDTIIGGNVWSGQIVNLRKDGQRYTQETTIGPVRDESGETISYVGVARDISKQLMIEAQLRQAQKLESIGELAAGIAHEINTPTQYVSTNAQFMEEAYGTLMKMLDQCKALVEGVLAGKPQDELLRLAEAALDEEELTFLAEDIPHALEESMAGLKRIAEIVQSVKQLAHPGEVHKGLHSLNEIVTNAVTVSTSEWKYVADVSLDLEEDMPELHCLKGEVGQVVLNLIVNGAHAIESKRSKDNNDEKGHLRLRTYRDGDSLVLAVEDSGTGMSQDVLKKAFDPFFTTKDVGKGTGQGLAIAHNVVVNMHCGKIDVETKEGIGTTFIVKLPINAECVFS